MSTNSPFESFNTFELRFEVKSGERQRDANHNLVRGYSVVVELRCTLKATSDPRVLALVGADALTVGLRGRCVEPMQMPSSLRAGMTCPLEVNGVKGVFTLGPNWPGSIQEVTDALGSIIIGAWRAG